MNDRIIAFPKTKKRGRKRSKGPPADVIDHPIEKERKDNPVRAGIREYVLAKRLAERLKDHLASHDQERENRFAKWRNGDRIAPDALISTSHYGIATETFGEGPSMFRWAADSVRAEELLRPSQRDEALRLCIEQLNSLSLLARLGGLTSRHRSDAEAYDFAEQAFADFGRTLRILTFFGAVSKPTSAEREILDKSKAAFDAVYNKS